MRCRCGRGLVFRPSAMGIVPVCPKSGMLREMCHARRYAIRPSEHMAGPRVGQPMLEVWDDADHRVVGFICGPLGAADALVMRAEPYGPLPRSREHGLFNLPLWHVHGCPHPDQVLR